MNATELRTSPHSRTRSTYAYLNQGAIWLPQPPQEPVWIRDMEPEWRYNCARLLLRNAAEYACRYEVGLIASGTILQGEAAIDAFDQMLEEHFRTTAADPQGWMRTTTLFQALTARLPRKPQRLWRLAQRARHWAPCPARRSNSAPCSCAPGTAAGACLTPAPGLPVPVLVVGR